MTNFTEKLKDDLVEQFKDKRNINAVLESFGEQLQAVYDFFGELESSRSLDSAEGCQLDNAGDIIVLTRAEAAQLAYAKTENIDDDVYRKYLIYKVLKNSNTCTYGDIIKSFKMFWQYPLYYTEDYEQPATMIFTTDALSPDASPEQLHNAPIIKPAGVGIKVTAITENPVIADFLYLGTNLGQSLMSTTLPEITIAIDFNCTERVTAVAYNITNTILPNV